MSTKGSAKAKDSPSYRCSECGWGAYKWVGRCGECQQWGTVLETVGTAKPTTSATVVSVSAQPLSAVSASPAPRVPTGVGEFDRVLGGGLVAGAVVLLAGEPGVGKSTLLLAVAHRVAAQGKRVLYLSGEESAGQVRLRAERMSAFADNLLFAAEVDLGAVLAHIADNDPDLLLVDSIQTLASAQVDGAPGGTAQVKEVVSALISVAKERELPLVLVGHVTKDGQIAGPRLVEHLVDVVCQFEGDHQSQLRLLRAVKNRFGSVDEVGCFTMVDTGIAEVPDPSGLFLSEYKTPIPGTCPTITIEGRRALPAEIQALVAPSALNNPRRATAGVDNSRVAMLLAVLHRRAGMAIFAEDVYVSTVGGAKLAEPAIDLAVAIALASARSDRPVRESTVVIGEVALSGAIRPVRGLNQRLQEAVRLGFTHAIVPNGEKLPAIAGLQIVPVTTIRTAVEAALMPA